MYQKMSHKYSMVSGYFVVVIVNTHKKFKCSINKVDLGNKYD